MKITSTGSSKKPLGSNHTPLEVAIVDGSGNQVTTFGGTGGTSSADGDAYTAGSTQGTPLMGAMDDAATAALAEGDVGIARLTAQRAIHVNLRDASGTELSAGAGVQYTEADTDATISGTAILWEDAADTLRAVSAAKPLPIGDAGGSLTVDGTVAVTGVSTAAKQDTQITAEQAIQASVELIDDVVKTDDAAFTPATTKVLMVGFEFDDTAPDSVDEGDAGAARMSARREIYVQLRDAAGNERGVNIDAAGALAVAAHAVNAGTNLNTSALALEAGGNLAGAATSLAVMDDWDESDRAKVNPIVGQAGVAGGTGVDGATVQRVSLATNVALPAGTNAIGKLAANSGVDIGDVDVTSAVITGGATAHDAADAGNPIKIGAKAETSPKGITLVADADRSDLLCDADGMLMVKVGTSYADLQSERVANTDGASTVLTTFGAAANLRNFITSVTIHNAHATTNGYVDLRDGSAGAIIYTFPAPATGGVTHNFNPPLRQPTANTALAFDVSAAITTIYISINGFQSKA